MTWEELPGLRAFFAGSPCFLHLGAMSRVATVRFGYVWGVQQFKQVPTFVSDCSGEVYRHSFIRKVRFWSLPKKRFRRVRFRFGFSSKQFRRFQFAVLVRFLNLPVWSNDADGQWPQCTDGWPPVSSPRRFRGSQNAISSS